MLIVTVKHKLNCTSVTVWAADCKRFNVRNNWIHIILFRTSIISVVFWIWFSSYSVHRCLAVWQMAISSLMQAHPCMHHVVLSFSLLHGSTLHTHTHINCHSHHQLCIIQLPTLNMEHKGLKLHHCISTGSGQTRHLESKHNALYINSTLLYEISLVHKSIMSHQVIRFAFLVWDKQPHTVLFLDITALWSLEGKRQDREFNNQTHADIPDIPERVLW